MAEGQASLTFSLSDWFSILTILIEILGVASNAWSAYRIWHTFNVKVALYLILFLDSCVCVLRLSVSLLSVFISIIYPAFLDRTGCNLILDGLIYAQVGGCIVLSLISLLR